MTLAELQAIFRDAIVDPGSVPAARLEACFAGTAAFPAERRVDVYAGMYAARLEEALRDTFPLVARWLGEEDFSALASDYLRRNPSEHPDIGRVGRRLPAFLRAFPDPARPGLEALARLEWTRNEVFFAAEAASLAADALAGVAPGRFAGARLRLVPALAVIRLARDVTPVWRRLDAGERAGEAAPGPATVAVWRPRFDVVHAALPAEEARALRLARAGRPLADVCAAFGGCPDPGAAASGALASWFAEGWVGEVLR